MEVAIDAIGGAYAPEEIVKGVVIVAKEYDVDIILVRLRELKREVIQRGAM